MDKKGQMSTFKRIILALAVLFIIILITKAIYNALIKQTGTLF